MYMWLDLQISVIAISIPLQSQFHCNYPPPLDFVFQEPYVVSSVLIMEKA